MAVPTSALEALDGRRSGWSQVPTEGNKAKLFSEPQALSPVIEIAVNGPMGGWAVLVYRQASEAARASPRAAPYRWETFLKTGVIQASHGTLGPPHRDGSKAWVAL